MNNSGYFITGTELPKVLSKQEVYELLDKIKSGDIKSREKLILHNLRYVIYEAEKYESLNCDLGDLICVGNMGLIKAVDSFRFDKGTEFITYASKCIHNEILYFLRRQKNQQGLISLDKPLYVDESGIERSLSDFISDDIDIEEDFVNKDTLLIIRELVDRLKGREREIIVMYFGFYGNHRYSQKEIADKLKITQSYVSWLTKRIVKRLKFQLEYRMEFDSKQKVRRIEN